MKRLVLLAALLGFAALGVIPASAPARAAAAAGPSLQVSLSEISPPIPQPGDTLTFAGTVTNRSSVAVDGLEELLIYDPERFSTRSSLDSYATGSGVFGFVAPGGSHHLAVRTLAPGASEPFRVEEPVNGLGLDPTQVGSYRIGVQIAGYTRAGAPVSATIRTFLPWWPLDVPGAPQATPVAWLWPVVGRPPVSGVAIPAALPGELSANGRLSAIVSAGSAAQDLVPAAGRPAGTGAHGKPRPAVLPTDPVPLNWVIDPMLTDEARTMAAGYTVHGHPGPGRAGAGEWLARLSTAAPGGSVIGLPYADPDVVAETRAGLTNELALARRAGSGALKADIGTAPLPAYSVPPGGLLDQATANELATLGYRDVVVSDTVLPAASQVFTHSALSRLPVAHGQLTALVPDSVLSQVVASGASAGTGGQLLAAQRYLAETLFIDYEYPLVRALVIAPPLRWAPSASYAGMILSDTSHAPWLTPMTLPQIVADPKVDVANRLSLSYPQSARQDELPQHYLSPVAETQHRLNLLDRLFAQPNNPLVRGMQQALLRSLSSYWRSDLTAGGELRRSVTSQVNGDLSGVQVFSAGTVTFTSHHGTVPLTIVNHLPQPVRVRVHLLAPAATIQQPPGPIVVAAGQAVQHEIALSLQAAGTFPLEVQLQATDGSPIGPPVELRIRSTAYGAIAVGITGGAFAVLLVAVLLRLLRRARGARAPDRP